VIVYRPDLDFETDTEQLTPAQTHDRWERVTNLDTPELERLEDSKRNEVYLERASGNQDQDNPPLPGGPLEDAQTLAETPRDEWTSEHRAEAEEAINFLSRTLPQFEQSEGEALIDDGPKIHKDELSIARWGVDVAPEDDFL
jgi:hypothetical protein